MSLDLSVNQLTSFVIKKPMKNLNELKLNKNKLKTVDFDLKIHLPNLENIDLSQNSLTQLTFIDSGKNKSMASVER